MLSHASSLCRCVAPVTEVLVEGRPRASRVRCHVTLWEFPGADVSGWLKAEDIMYFHRSHAPVGCASWLNASATASGSEERPRRRRRSARSVADGLVEMPRPRAHRRACVSSTRDGACNRDADSHMSCDAGGVPRADVRHHGC